MISASALSAGLPDPVMDSQRVFRTVMMALARPGSLHRLQTAIAPPSPLFATTASLALALADFESPVWLDAPLASEPAVSEFLRFHTGATLVQAPNSAAFGLVSDAAGMPAFSLFSLGTLEYPDRSTTLIIQVEALEAGSGWLLTGPGMEHTARLHAAPLPAEFVARLADNRSRFPCGLDIVFAAHHHIAALPRTTVVTADRSA